MAARAAAIALMAIIAAVTAAPLAQRAASTTATDTPVGTPPVGMLPPLARHRRGGYNGKQCAGNPATFDAGFGGCSTYATSQFENHAYCAQDINKAGEVAENVCHECGACTTKETMPTMTHHRNTACRPARDTARAPAPHQTVGTWPTMAATSFLGCKAEALRHKEQHDGFIWSPSAVNRDGRRGLAAAYEDGAKGVCKFVLKGATCVPGEGNGNGHWDSFMLPAGTTTGAACKTQPDVDYEGHDLFPVKHTSAKKCQDKCLATSACTHFTFIKKHSNTCYLKKGKKWYMYPTPYPGATSGVCTGTTKETTTTPEYVHHPKGCVGGHNIKLYNGKTVQECKSICDKTAGCVAFEYGVAHGGVGGYKPAQCQPQSSANKAGCPGAYHNLDLYVKQ